MFPADVKSSSSFIIWQNFSHFQTKSFSHAKNLIASRGGFEANGSSMKSIFPRGPPSTNELEVRFGEHFSLFICKVMEKEKNWSIL